MAKIHVRLSVEIDVTDEQMEKLVGMSQHGENFCDVDVIHVSEFIDMAKNKVCDWDFGGYIPGSWLEYDYEDWKEERK